MDGFVSATCEGERCRCGAPAARKVGEEIPIDDPNPARHNLTAYVCARHYAELMGPAAADFIEQSLTPPPSEDAMREAAQALVNKLDRVTEDSASVFTLAAVHGCEYRGAQYGEELEALRTILASPIEKEVVGDGR